MMSAGQRLALLQTISLKGTARPDRIATTLGRSPAVTAEDLDTLASAAMLTVSTAGVSLTSVGRHELARLLAAERSDLDAAELDRIYEQFCPVNDRFKELILAWQMTDDHTPNDHSDTGYDSAIIGRLAGLHAAAAPILAAAAAQLPRLHRHARRLTDALGYVQAGQPSYICSPFLDSYHTIWFELHEELITAAGRTREQEAAAGRAT
jgi:hypothetical protein